MSAIPARFSHTGSTATSDAWRVTITGLEALSGRNGNTDVEPLTGKPSRKASSEEKPEHHQSHAVVTFVERVTERSILVDWCDSTSCHYNDQLWTKRLARHAGHCALTGNAITRGDAVYAPSTRVPHPPVNERAMILASSVND